MERLKPARFALRQSPTKKEKEEKLTKFLYRSIKFIPTLKVPIQLLGLTEQQATSNLLMLQRRL